MTSAGWRVRIAGLLGLCHPPRSPARQHPAATPVRLPSVAGETAFHRSLRGRTGCRDRGAGCPRSVHSSGIGPATARRAPARQCRVPSGRIARSPKATHWPTRCLPRVDDRAGNRVRSGRRYARCHQKYPRYFVGTGIALAGTSQRWRPSPALVASPAPPRACWHPTGRGTGAAVSGGS